MLPPFKNSCHAGPSGYGKGTQAGRHPQARNTSQVGQEAAGGGCRPHMLESPLEACSENPNKWDSMEDQEQHRQLVAGESALL